MFPELNRAEAQRYLDGMKRSLGSASKSNVKSDFSPYSRESSVQSFSSTMSQNRGSASGFLTSYSSYLQLQHSSPCLLWFFAVLDGCMDVLNTDSDMLLQ